MNTDWGVHYLDLDEDTRKELLIYLGKNDETYEKRWTKMSEKRRFFSWNWSAFFAVSFWSVHRKLYYLSYGYLAFWIVDSLFSDYVPVIVDYSICFGVGLLFTLFANYFCFLGSLRELNRLKQEIPDRNERLSYLHKNPGYSWKAFWIYFLIQTALMIILSFT
ncbi:DUF2628 domain-containing protein [Sporolactobacillus laevolacticus]|uniref:DUF2628 domain-containing protein n=1 Tax=Sporolactobacillus laevolacticus TaxID=33018 RepID=UPI0025B3B0AA|nr:DUF2628 domain-containing protein [Sporolactobacillus laevolacticus]MDN3954530.1 DUF2628 domain-containing protein [Sporolactobacillus laevolacticus]